MKLSSIRQHAGCTPD